MSAILKLDQSMIHRLLGLPGSPVMHKDKMGVQVGATTEGDKPFEIVVNSRLTLLLPTLDVRRYTCIVVPHPTLHEVAVVAGTSVIPPDMGPVTPRLHLTGLRKFNVAELPWAALVYLID